MVELSRVTIFMLGVFFGVFISFVIAGLVWISKTKGFDRPLTDDEVRERIGTTWGDN